VRARCCAAPVAGALLPCRLALTLPPRRPGASHVAEKCVSFLNNFTVPGEGQYDAPRKKYVEMLVRTCFCHACSTACLTDRRLLVCLLQQDVVNRVRVTVAISCEDVIAYDQDGSEAFASNLQTNSSRYIALFASAIDDLVNNLPPTVEIEPDVIDVLHAQRQQQAAAAVTEGTETSGIPPELMRRYEIVLIPPQGKVKPVSIRAVKAEHIGSLVEIRGMVTRVMDVKPQLVVGVYTCDTCGYELYQSVSQSVFTPIAMCESPQCRENKQMGKLFMQTRGSKFVKYQEVRLQELPDQVPMGHIPRTMTVQLKGELTRSCGPGDSLSVAGIFLPKRKTGFNQSGLISETFLQATSVKRHKKSYSDMTLTPEMQESIREAAATPDIYSRLASSIAPEIFGHEDVKRALLLLLVGGVTRHMKDGMKIRGDINICLMGDPGVAKSQLLKHITSVAPRSVYTTGKGSSGVGLTAAVIRDPVTGEMALEGGALVLADMGICCIDEFDKMDDSDRSAIHEVMEQQTVSIAKAGITTTLNARTAILAAANPLYGRYNRKLSVQQNVNLPNALLSRFDLIFLLLDKADMDADTDLARHIVSVHKHCKHPDLDVEPLETNFLKSYISQARNLDPFIPEDLTTYIIEAYVGLRQDDLSDSQGKGETHIMTARMLLSILRLSQGLARLRFSEQVAQADVDEAMRLVHMSKVGFFGVTNSVLMSVGCFVIAGIIVRRRKRI
jgi:DNA replication licensing factor MCM7